MSRIDIIIPAYNAAHWLPFSLDSVIAQSCDEWQIVLVDDGSTDNTPETLAPYVRRLGSRLRYIRQENRGLPAARNTAIRNSTSEFLALLDADDIWLPNRAQESLRSFANQPQVGLTYGLIERIDAAGRVTETFRGNRAHASGSIAPYIYMRKVELPCPTITFRRKCIEEVGLFDETMRATEDRDLWLRIAQRHQIGFIPKVIAQYRTSSSSMSTDPSRMLKAQLQYIHKHYGTPGCTLRTRQVALARAYKQRAEALKLLKLPGGALLSSLRALLLYPLDFDNYKTAGSLTLNWIRSSSRI